MKKYILILVLILVASGLFYYKTTHIAPKEVTTSEQAFMASADYECDGGKMIYADYYEGEQLPPNEDGSPNPNGRVELSLDGMATTTLAQTISGSGVRFANSDESFVFWEKGPEVLIMRNNAMDLEYTNCHAHVH